MTQRKGRVVVVFLVLFAIGITWVAMTGAWVGDACREHTSDCAACCAKLGKQPARPGPCECIAKNR